VKYKLCNTQIFIIESILSSDISLFTKGNFVILSILKTWMTFEILNTTGKGVNVVVDVKVEYRADVLKIVLK